MNVDELDRLIRESIAKGRYTEALEHLRKLSKYQPQIGKTQFRLAVMEEAFGEASEAWKAYRNAIKCSPQDAYYYLYAGYFQQSRGQDQSALAIYSLASELDDSVFYAWKDDSLDRDSRRRSLEAAKFMRNKLTEMHLECVDKVPGAARARKAVWSRTHNERFSFPEGQQPQLFYVPDLPSQPFFDLKNMDWVVGLEARFSAIKNEYVEVVRRGSLAGRPYIAGNSDLHGQFRELSNSQQWTAFDVFRDGVPDYQAQHAFPETMDALKNIPLYDLDGSPYEVFFSVLGPNSKIPPHYGLSNHCLTVHLPLIVPGEGALTVSNQARPWQEGKTMIFDDTFMHSAENQAGADRVVLIFSVWHPDLAPPEREAIRKTILARQKWLELRHERAQLK
ncbi:aspartyl/asparaginyl beta-hydroxylase domain-containing protein [Microbulbifer guangxiensis]|uniref:aspartyl/asparaginyl beta-hydroxylase domain-containing protein n=1 Tax=Microbulbifer guangxiensis TaxID=2904249 RepID=UPI001F023A7C|nr:aspartyl/asparaginyl beta-hydroxylase domain-containing protein [Microbulbifer guangxiensis]